LFYSIALLSLAGAVTGALFKVRTLLILLAFILSGSATLVFVHGSIVWEWTFANIVSIEFGYFAGILSRHLLEEAGYSLPDAQTPP
jgi:hypothetical protein